MILISNSMEKPFKRMKNYKTIENKLFYIWEFKEKVILLDFFHGRLFLSPFQFNSSNVPLPEGWTKIILSVSKGKFEEQNEKCPDL